MTCKRFLTPTDYLFGTRAKIVSPGEICNAGSIITALVSVNCYRRK